MLMKIKNLLFLGAMLLIGGTASAAIVDGVRQKPVPEKVAFNYGDTLYMYNVGAKMFWGGGNDWNTRASVVEEGVQVVFIKELVNGEWDGKTSTLRNWCVQHNRWDNVFVGGADGTMWVDNSTDPNHFWNLLPQSNEVYRLQVSDMNTGFPGDGTTFVGHNATLDNGANTRTWAFLTPGEGMNIDWYFVNKTGFDAYMALIPAYNASKALLAVIEEAKAKGADASAAQAVYENEASTVEEINAAVEALQKAIAALDEAGVTPDNPADKTSLIANPGFDAVDGWLGTTPALGATVAEQFNKTFDTYQDLSGMPNGVYMLEAQAFYRCAPWGTAEAYDHFINGTAKNVALYAKAEGDQDSIFVAIKNIFDGATAEKLGVSGEAEIAVSSGEKLWVPRDMSSANDYFVAGRYHNKVYFSVENNKARVGLAKKTGIGDDWVLFDNFALTYYGSSADSYKFWMQQIVAEAPNFDNLPEGKYVTNGVVDTYKAAIEAVSGAATKADILAAQAAIAEAAAVVEKNIAAWDSLVIARNKAEATSADPGIADTDEKMALGDYVWDLDDMIAALELTTEELLAEARKVLEMIDYVYANAMIEGTDVTEKFLVNADYSNGTTGWKGSWTAVNYGCMEAYERDWDAYQEVTSAPVGVYEVSLQGFYRVKRGNDAWTMWKNGEQTCPGHVYVNNNQTEVPCVFSESVNILENIYSGTSTGPEGNYCKFEAETLDTLCFPNDMATAGEAFAKGMYKASAFGLVAKPGDVLRLGVKGKKQTATWVIWDNFRMVYQGFKVEIIKPELKKALDNVKESLKKPMGKSVKAGVADVIAAGEAAFAQTDGKVMFDALSALYSANDSIAPSIALFEELAKVAADMFTQASTSTAAQDVITEAEGLYAVIMGSIDDGILEDADAEAYIIKVKEMNTKLRIPGGDASDESPLDMTSVIYTPGFEKDGANSIEGWENTDGYSFGNDDTQKAALMVEFYQKKFDIYQDIVGLPNGMYEVAVQAFCSFGNSETDYKNFTENPSVNEAWLYAIPANDSTQMATAYLKHRSSEAGPDKGYTGTTTITGANGESLVMPNDVVSSGNYMSNEGLYWNKVIVKVTDGTLRIGVAKPEQIAGDWVIMDNWTLKYFGENSTKTPTGDIVTSIETVGGEAAVVTNVEFFSINGAKMNGLSKGINIMKSTMSDGSVIVKKIVVR